jgi:hypothetical protein
MSFLILRNRRHKNWLIVNALCLIKHGFITVSTNGGVIASTSMMPRDLPHCRKYGSAKVQMLPANKVHYRIYSTTHKFVILV